MIQCIPSSGKPRQFSVILIVCLAVSMALLIVHSGAGITSTSGSWNPSVNCTPTLVSLESLIGGFPNPSQTAPAQGADYSGGAYRFAGIYPAGSDPSSTLWPFSKRSLTPPCTATNADGKVVGTLVEIHNLKVMSTGHDECGSVFPSTCDDTVNLCNNALAPSCANSFPDTMHLIHSEIDMYWNHAGTAPTQPAYGTMIDVQGFIFWDDGHTGLSWHHYSGWELHPFTAWRLAGSGPPPPPPAADFSISLSPSSLTIHPGGSGISTVTLTSLNGFVGTVALSHSAPPGGTTVSFNPVTVTLTSGGTGSSTATFAASATATRGTFPVVVTGTSGSLTHSSTVSLTVSATGSPDFVIGASPASVTIIQGGSAASTITLTSLNGFSGSVSLSHSPPPSGATITVKPVAVTLASGGSSRSSITFKASPTAATGTFTITLTGTSGTLMHSVTIRLTVTGNDNCSNC